MMIGPNNQELKIYLIQFNKVLTYYCNTSFKIQIKILDAN